MTSNHLQRDLSFLAHAYTRGASELQVHAFCHTFGAHYTLVGWLVGLVFGSDTRLGGPIVPRPGIDLVLSAVSTTTQSNPGLPGSPPRVTFKWLL